jgi:hypothetical protein
MFTPRRYQEFATHLSFSKERGFTLEGAKNAFKEGKKKTLIP